jgi:hypothetical protein
MFASAENEQTEERDATASPNNESASEAGDCDATPNCTYVHLVGPLVNLNVFLISPRRKYLIFSNDIGLWAISVSKEISYCV